MTKPKANKSLDERKPEDRAYTQEIMTDSIQTWGQGTFDLIVPPTPDDMAKVVAGIARLNPEGRIKILRDNLASLQAKDITPAIQFHADAIRKSCDAWSGRGNRTYDALEELSTAEKCWRKILILRDVMPLAKKGERFKPGKDAGAVSPLTKAIAKYLKKYPNATAAEVWEALSAKPLKGHTFRANRLGKYIERETTDGLKETKYARFMNIVSEEKRKLSA